MSNCNESVGTGGDLASTHLPRRGVVRLLTRRWYVRPLLLLRGVRELSAHTLAAIGLQWLSAILIAHTLADPAAIAHARLQALVCVAALLCGPVSCFAVVRSLRRTRNRHRQRERLLHSVQHDDLTGLPNRAAMHQHLAERLREAAGDGSALHCLYLDLDGLRHANALLGYKAGDQLLQQIVARVANCLLPADHFSRFGGDKFVVLLHRGISRFELNALAQCMVHAISRPHVVDGRAFTTGVSIGIATGQAPMRDGEALLSAAERAMYLVKRSGRGSYRHADQEGETTASRHELLAEKLQRALVNDELHLQYQPIYDRKNRIIAAEVLARWNDPELGSISPVEFIPIAEETGLIVPLSKWALRSACNQAAAWQTSGATLQRVAVNICVLQIAREDFVETVREALQETGLPPECLDLEVTENALAKDFASVKAHLQQLRELGVRISIDDFGTGYSSFGRLRELPADAMKIDRIFVQGAHETPNGLVVLQTLIAMAHTLNLSVVAEGVETAEQMQMLQSLRCDEMQGFLLGRPQDPEEFARRLRFAPCEEPVRQADEYAGFALPGFA